ncbi:hypothetical protein RND71_032393 [Anisodus tanguticus]|uniref:Uncharacterized protein n=1 Tax=Anisodus tanguticus TaxID=243964 RepID=A0AAE1REI9_9SOLA|nr:hypothetical protein RND71_032393 [Anisodus tanguticus]
MENLSGLAIMYPNVKILHFDVDVRNNRMDFKEMKRMEVNCRQYEDVQLTYRVAQRLMCLKYSDQDEHSLREALQNLKESYIGGRF